MVCMRLCLKSTTFASGYGKACGAGGLVSGEVGRPCGQSLEPWGFGAVPANAMDNYVFLSTSSISVSPAAVGVLGNQHSKALSAPLCPLARRICRGVA